MCEDAPVFVLVGVESGLGNGILSLRNGAPGQLKRRQAVQAALWGVHMDTGEPASSGTGCNLTSLMASVPALAVAGVESELCHDMLFLRDGAPGQFKRRHAVQAASLGVHTDNGEPAGATVQQGGAGIRPQTSSGLRAVTPGSSNGFCCPVARVLGEDMATVRAC